MQRANAELASSLAEAGALLRPAVQTYALEKNAVTALQWLHAADTLYGIHTTIVCTGSSSAY